LGLAAWPTFDMIAAANAAIRSRERTRGDARIAEQEHGSRAAIRTACAFDILLEIFGRRWRRARRKRAPHDIGNAADRNAVA